MLLTPNGRNGVVEKLSEQEGTLQSLSSVKRKGSGERRSEREI